MLRVIIFKAWVVMAHMHYFTLRNIEAHAPPVGPPAHLVQRPLHFSCILLCRHLFAHLGVVLEYIYGNQFVVTNISSHRTFASTRTQQQTQYTVHWANSLVDEWAVPIFRQIGHNIDSVGKAESCSRMMRYSTRAQNA